MKTGTKTEQPLDANRTAQGHDRSALEISDATLLARIAAGDRASFDQLCHRHYAGLYRFLIRMTQRPEDVEELLNDTLMAVWQSAERFDGRSKPSTWIYGVAHKKALMLLRRRGILTGCEGDELLEEVMCPEPNPEQVTEDSLLRRNLKAALKSLSPAHRAVIELTYYRDYSCQEIADALECPVNTVKTRMFHARAHLRRLLVASQVAEVN